MKELFRQYKDANENWFESEIYLKHEQTNETLRSGEREYITLKDLRKEHGDTKAEELAAEKKRKQLTGGNFLPRVPWHMEHPDWPRDQARYIEELLRTLL